MRRAAIAAPVLLLAAAAWFLSTPLSQPSSRAAESARTIARQWVAHRELSARVRP